MLSLRQYRIASFGQQSLSQDQGDIAVQRCVYLCSVLLFTLID